MLSVLVSCPYSVLILSRWRYNQDHASRASVHFGEYETHISMKTPKTLHSCKVEHRNHETFLGQRRAGRLQAYALRGAKERGENCATLPSNLVPINGTRYVHLERQQLSNGSNKRKTIHLHKVEPSITAIQTLCHNRRSNRKGEQRWQNGLHSWRLSSARKSARRRRRGLRRSPRLRYEK